MNNKLIFISGQKTCVASHFSVLELNFYWINGCGWLNSDCQCMIKPHWKCLNKRVAQVYTACSQHHISIITSLTARTEHLPTKPSLLDNTNVQRTECGHLFSILILLVQPNYTRLLQTSGHTSRPFDLQKMTVPDLTMAA